MRLDMSQQMRMLQQMKLAPRMIQSMEILQLPIMALEERIRQEEEENPVLDVGASVTEKPTTDLEAQESNGSTSDLNNTDAESKTSDETQYEAAFEQLAEEWSENYIPPHQPSRLAGLELSDKKHDAMQNIVDRQHSLEEHLIEQLSLVEEEPEILDFARYLIANLTPKGFLNGPLQELQTSYDGVISDKQALRALDVVQELDPAGVGARDLRESLLLQLKDPSPEIHHVEVLRTLLANHLDDLNHNRLPAIERKTGFSIATLQEAVAELRHLDLNPGGEFSAGQTQYVVPDVKVETDTNGEFVIKMNDDNTPRVRISKNYVDMFKSGDKDAQDFVKKKIAAAQWLIDSIAQRRNTLEKVTKAIIEHQRQFLEKGPEYIEPLKMQQIADKVGVHVTTVSRAVDDKWIETPRGIFKLKRFFGGGTVTASGEEVAWDTIKRKLTEIIDSEEKSDPFSDDELVKRLREIGYPLARRTVTKYRKNLGIPSSRERKQHG